MKRRFFTIMVVLAAMLAGFSVSAKSYDLWICGKQLTDDNIKNFEGDGITGKILYSEGNKLLNFVNVTLTSYNGAAIVTGIDNLTMTIEGTLSITAHNGNPGIVATKDFGFAGLSISESKVSIVSTDTGIYLDNCLASFRNLSLLCNGKWGIRGAGGDLKMENCHAEVCGNGGASISGLYSFKFDECAITAPAGAAFYPSRQAVVLNGEEVEGKVVIDPVKFYGIKVGGNPVHERNKNNVTGESIKGFVSYNPEKKRLTLDGVKITSLGDNGISSVVQGLEIYIKGFADIVSSTAGIGFTADTKIRGDGIHATRLKVTSLDNAGIYVGEGTLTAENLTMNIIGGWGVTGNQSLTSNVSLKNCRMYSVGEKGSVCDLNSFSLSGCQITAPSGAVFDPNLHSVALNGKIVTETVEVGDPSEEDLYNLYLNGTRVGVYNQDRITGNGISGTVKYDVVNNRLILKDAVIKGTGNYGIETGIPGLDIYIDGTVTVESDVFSAIYCVSGCTITGKMLSSSKLNVVSGGNVGIYLPKTNVHISNLKLNVSGKWGINGIDGDVERVSINKCCVKATGSNGSISNIKTLSLDSCEIISPAGAVFDAGLRAVALNGTPVTDTVEIKAIGKGLGIWVGDVEVTDANCDNITGDGIRGHAEYNPETNTLLLRNASVESFNKAAVDVEWLSSDTPMNINIEGTVNINAHNNHAGIGINGTDITLSGTDTQKSKLNILSDGAAVYLDNSKTCFCNLALTAQGKWGISGHDDWEYIYFKNCDAKVSGNGQEASITRLNGMDLQSARIISPAGAAFDGTLHAVALNGKAVTETVEIKGEGRIYDITVGDILVTEANKDAVVGDGITGTISYNPEKNILTLKDAVIEMDKKGIDNNIPGLEICIDGTVNIKTPGFGIVTYKDLVIKGKGISESVLNVHVEGNTGIYAYKTNLAFEDVSVNVTGYRGLAGFNGAVEEVTVKNSNMKVVGEAGSIVGIKSLALDSCKIISPAGAAFDAELHGVAIDGKIVADTVEIRAFGKEYDLYVAGVRVTDLNKDAVAGEGITGIVTYNSEKNILTLKDVAIEGSQAYYEGITNYIPGLKIFIDGTVDINLKAGKAAAISCRNETFITGKGISESVLNVYSEGSTGIYVLKTNLKIEGVNINTTGKWGLAGYDGTEEEVIVKNSKVKATGTVYNAFCDIKSLTLDGCFITVPAGAAFDAGLHGVALNGELVTETVEIDTDGSGIEGVIADEAEDLNAPMFNVMGQQIKQPYNGQIYIQNGKKKVYRK